MSKATNQPRRQPVYRTVQFWLAGIGGWMVLTGSLIGSNPPAAAPTQPAATATKLKVEPARQQPGDTTEQLQNAGGLQRQTSEVLQQPTSSDQLQPNAKSDSFGSPAAPSTD